MILWVSGCHPRINFAHLAYKCSAENFLKDYNRELFSGLTFQEVERCLLQC